MGKSGRSVVRDNCRNRLLTSLVQRLSRVIPQEKHAIMGLNSSIGKRQLGVDLERGQYVWHVTPVRYDQLFGGVLCKTPPTMVQYFEEEGDKQWTSYWGPSPLDNAEHVIDYHWSSLATSEQICFNGIGPGNPHYCRLKRMSGGGLAIDQPVTKVADGTLGEDSIAFELSIKDLEAVTRKYDKSSNKTQHTADQTWQANNWQEKEFGERGGCRSCIAIKDYDKKRRDRIVKTGFRLSCQRCLLRGSEIAWS